MAESRRRLSFEDHRRELGDFRYVYPVLSRRARGVSVGINLNPDKGCNFDCVYCQVDRTGPRTKPGVDLDVLAAELTQLLGWVQDGSLFSRPPFDTAPEALRVVRDVSFAGDGEPTTYPRFDEAMARTLAVVDAAGLPDLPINVITNATRLHHPTVARGLALLDGRPGDVWAKLDAGTEAYYHLVDVTRVPFTQILSNIEAEARRRPLVIQSLFITWDGAPPSAAEIAAWCGRLQALVAAGGTLKLIQVTTVARRPPTERVGALKDAQVDAIADAARQALPGVPVEAYYGAAQLVRDGQGVTREGSSGSN